MARRIFLVFVLTLFLAIGILPVFSMLIKSVIVDGCFDLTSYRGLLASTHQWTLMGHSMALSSIVTVLTVVAGLFMGILLEKTDLPDLRKFGFEHVFYMPAGSPLQPDADFSDPAFSYLQDRISFVGNTFLDAQERWFHPRYPELYEELDFTKWDAHQKTLVDFIIEEQVTQFSSEGELFHYAGYVAGRSTMENRIELLKQIPNPVVFGDRHWPELGLNVEIHPPVHPAETAPKIFKASQINLNISSTQLHTSVNQRVFDVPLSGGFLLTDWRESLAELFDPEKELVVYNSEEELKDKIDYYKNHDTERNKITTRAAERVEKEHLLEHRIQKMLELMKKTFQ